MTENLFVWGYVAGILLGFLLGMPVMYALWLGWWGAKTRFKEEEKEETLLGHPIHWTEDSWEGAIGEGEVVLTDFRDYVRFKAKMRTGGEK